MNLSFIESEIFMGKFFQQQPEIDHLNLILAPSFPFLPKLKEMIQNHPIQIAAQDTFWMKSGAYTGEVSPLMLKEMGCSYVLVGHSERRQYFGETDIIVEKKAIAVHQARMIPIVCIGEHRESYEEGKTRNVILQQLERVKSINPLWVAYEPVWSIGSGKIPSKEEVAKVTDLILSECPHANVLYGGSVSIDNQRMFCSIDSLHGLLVGGLSVKLPDFCVFLEKFKNI